MNDAHVESLQLLATPFRKDTPQPFAFEPGSMWAGITAKIRERILTVLQVDKLTLHSTVCISHSTPL